MNNYNYIDNITVSKVTEEMHYVYLGMHRLAIIRKSGSRWKVDLDFASDVIVRSSIEKCLVSIKERLLSMGVAS